MSGPPKTSVASLANPLKQGWLTKQGGSIKTWKRRWFVLKGATLWYFKSEKDGEQTGFIVLESNSVCQLEPSKSKKNSYHFSVSTAKRVFSIVADVDKDAKEWVDLINKSIQEKKGGGGSSDPPSQPTPPPEPSLPSNEEAPATTTTTTTTSTSDTASSSAAGAAEEPSVPAAHPPKKESGGSSSEVSPRDIIILAKGVVSFLQDDESKVLEFWQLWQDSIPPLEELTGPNLTIDYHVSTSADMQKLTWRTAGAQNIFIQKMVDFFWNVGAPESEIDRLNDVGTLINPVTIGSWIDMSAKGGMDGGWYFPVEISLRTALEAADNGEAVEKVLQWLEKHSVETCFAVGRDMGAAPPRQTEIRMRLPNETDFTAQMAIAVDAFEMFGFPPLPAEAVTILEETAVPGICLSVVTSSEGFVRLGLLSPKPKIETVVKLCELVGASNENLASFEGSLGTDGPSFAEYQFLKEGFGYGVYKEGFDIVFHYFVGEEAGE